jgi:hypothetical protein
VVETVVMGYALMICLPLSGIVSELESVSDSEAFTSSTSDCLEWQSTVLCQGLLWKLHHFLVSFFVFPMSFFAYILDGFPNSIHIIFVLFLCFGAALSFILLYRVPRPKLSRPLFEILLDFDDISIGRAQGRDVHKFHFGLDVSMQSTKILEHHMSLKIFDTQLGTQGMEDICELEHYLVSFFPQCGPFCI